MPTSKKVVFSAVIVAVVVVVVAILLSPRRSAAPEVSMQPSTSATPQPSVSTPAASVSVPAPLLLGNPEGPKDFTVTARQFSFDPATLKVKKGDRVRLRLVTVDVSHGIAIPAFGVNLTAPAGGTATTEFIADKVGTFDFFCSVFCGTGHRGMKGTLIVE